MTGRAGRISALTTALLSALARADPPLPEQLARHVTVDEARYAATPARLPTADAGLAGGPDYARTIADFHARYAEPRAYWLDRREPEPDIGANLEMALFFAFRAVASGERGAGRRALGFLEHAHRLGDRGAADPQGALPVSLLPVRIQRLHDWLERADLLQPQARRQLRDLLRRAVPRFPVGRVEYGVSNRPFGTALVGEILLHHLPDAPDAAAWRAYIDEVWRDFWRVRDTRENATHYNALWLRYLIDWVELRGDGAVVWSDPAIRRLLERYLLQVLPIGSLPHYGNSNGWNVEWGHWIFVFEHAARHTGDGRFRWAAQRIHEYSTQRIEDLSSWSYTGPQAIESLMRAHLVADRALGPRPPADDLVVASRPAVVPTPPARRPKWREFSVDPSRTSASKLMLRAGTSPLAPAALFELETAADHGPPTAPSLIALVDAGTVLLMDEGWIEHGPEYHDALLLEDYEGFPLHPERERVEVLETADSGPLLYARIRVESYRGYPADLEREVVFARPGAILVRDALTFRAGFRARVGPVYNLGVLGPELGRHWVNGYIGSSIPVRGIGRNTPVLVRWRNPTRDLLIFFPPRPDRTLEVRDRRERDPTDTLPLRVRQRWRGRVEAGQRMAFASLLLPHAPLRHPSALAARVRVLRDDAEATALEVPVTGPEGQRRAAWLVVGPIDTGALSSDARAAVAVTEGGRIVAAGRAGGSRFELRGGP